MTQTAVSRMPLTQIRDTEAQLHREKNLAWESIRTKREILIDILDKIPPPQDERWQKLARTNAGTTADLAMRMLRIVTLTKQADDYLKHPNVEHSLTHKVKQLAAIEELLDAAVRNANIIRSTFDGRIPGAKR